MSPDRSTRTRARSRGCRRLHSLRKHLSAATTAASTSPGVASATRASVSPVAGLTRSRPSAVATVGNFSAAMVSDGALVTAPPPCAGRPTFYLGDGNEPDEERGPEAIYHI